MHLLEPQSLLDQLAARGTRLVAVSSGGGSRAISHLVATPGASAVVVEGLVPYAREAVDRLLGGHQESFCSSRTARRLAVAAWQRATGCGAAPESALGAAVVASLQTVAPKRGAHRVIVATQTLSATSVASVELEKGARSRSDEEDLAAALLLRRIGDAVGADGARGAGGLRSGEGIEVAHTAAPPEWRRLLAGTARAVRIAARETTVTDDPAADRLVFPGSFDPLHDGHRAMARLAEEIAERPAEYELSIANVDKPLLDYEEIQARAAQFATETLWLTRAATFLEKLAIFPRSTFVLGADTFVRLADPRYYGGSTAAAAAATRTIADLARGLVVFGRAREGEFVDPAQLDVPQPLRAITYFVSEREFRRDISSTALRREKLGDDATA